MLRIKWLKWLLVGTLVLSVFSGVEPALADDDQTAYALPLEGITIDGRLDDWPREMAAYPIDWVSSWAYKETPPDGPKDLTARFHVGYNVADNLLYLAIVVQDDDLVVRPEAPSYETQDLCELYLHAPSGDLQRYAMVPGPGQFRPSEDGNPAYLNGRTSRSGVRAAYLNIGPHTVYEWAIPLFQSFPNTPFQIEAGKTIGFDVVVADADAQEKGNWVAWTPGEGKDADKVGALTFVEAYRGLDVALGRTVPANLDYRHLGSIRGRITYQDTGEPIRRAQVAIEAEDSSPRTYLTDRQGNYYRSVVPGTYLVGASARGTRAQGARQRVDVGRSDTVVADMALVDLGTRFYVDGDAPIGGDGTQAQPFRTIQQGLTATSYGDTVRLAPGTYSQPLELISGATILGAGAETILAANAYWGAVIEPLMNFGFLNNVALEALTLDGSAVDVPGVDIDGPVEFPTYSGPQVTDLLAMAHAMQTKDVDRIAALLRAQPQLATARLYTPDTHPTLGDTYLRMPAYASWDTPSTEVELRIAQLLIDAGADVNADGGSRYYTGHTPLATYGRMLDVPMVKLLLRNGADPNRLTSFGFDGISTASFDAPFYQPAQRAKVREMVDAMIEAGADYTLHHLVNVDHQAKLKEVLDAHPERVDEWREFGWWRGDVQGTPLHAAVYGNRFDMAALLLERGADIQATDSRGLTPLMRAVNCSGSCDEGFFDPEELEAMIQLLIQHGATADLLTAIRLGDAALARSVLAAHPAQAHGRSLDGWTMLDNAVRAGNEEIEQLVRQAGGQLDQHVSARLREISADHSLHVLMQHWPDGFESIARRGYLHVPHSSSLDIRDQITLSAWMYRLQHGDLVGKWKQRPKTNSFLLGMGGHTGFRLRFEDGTQANLTDYHVPLFQWVHYAATWDGAVMRVYLDGELVRQRQTEGKRLASTDNPVWIGSSGDGTDMPGLIDDVQIWNLARTQEQIQHSMRAGLKGDEPGLVGWWPLDEGATRDRSSVGNHGRLAGAGIIRSGAIPADSAHAPTHALWLDADAAPGSSAPPAASSYSAADDFSAEDNAAANTWSYRYKRSNVRDGHYALFGPETGGASLVLRGAQFTPGPNPVAWQLGREPPWVAVNTHAVDQIMPAEAGGGVSITWRPGALFVHPGDDGLVVVRWRAPVTGTADIDYSFTHVNLGCGNGIRWFVDRGSSTQPLADGVLARGEATGLQVLEDIEIYGGQNIDFIVDANDGHGCDWTELEASLRLGAE